MTPKNKIWRVGPQTRINVYEGDRPVCQCHNEEDAQRIVDAVNHVDNIKEHLAGEWDRRGDS